MTTSVSTPVSTDLGAAFQKAAAALDQVIQAREESDRLVVELARLTGDAVQAAGAGVWVTETPDRPVLIIENNLAALQLMTAAGSVQSVNAAVRRSAREGKPLIVPAFFVDETATGPAALEAPMNPTPYELLYVPMKLHGKVALVLMVAVSPPPVSDAGLHRTYLQFLLKMVGKVEATLTERHLHLMEKDRGTSSKLVKFADQVHKHLMLDQVAVDIANLARDVVEADRVTVELYPPHRTKKVLAVSNVDEPNKRAAVFQIQRLIFDYVRDRHVPVILDREAVQALVSDPVLQDAVSAYFAATEFNAFHAAPIKSDDPTSAVLGVVLTEYAVSAKAQATAPMLAEVARLSVQSVANANDVESVPFMKSFHALRDLFRKPGSAKRTRMFVIAGVIVIALAILTIIPFDFSIKGDCQIRPSAQLAIVAPMDARIVEVPVRAGEHVFAKSQRATLGARVKPLVVFDSTDLVAQRAEQAGRMGELQVQMKDFQDKGEMTKLGGVQKQIEQSQRQIDLLDHQIDECTVWSPIEGTVLTENVEQKRWSTPKKGEPLMEVASFSDWQLEVDVPESEVATLRKALAAATTRAANDGCPDGGVPVVYSLYPWPEQRYDVNAVGTASLLPASHQSRNANVFRLQVKLDGAGLPPHIAMSGVTGRAKMHIGYMPLAAQWLRGPFRALRMMLFF